MGIIFKRFFKEEISVGCCSAVWKSWQDWKGWEAFGPQRQDLWGLAYLFVAKVVEEGHRRCPDVIDFILTICAPTHRETVNKTKKGESRIPAIGLAYAVMMHQSNQQLSLVQQMNTLVPCHGHAEKIVMQFLFLSDKINKQCLRHTLCYSVLVSE